MQELTKDELLIVSGARRNLGTLYEYTGDPKDMTGEEKFWDTVGNIIDGAFKLFEQAWG